jgi:hypothetical protein
MVSVSNMSESIASCDPAPPGLPRPALPPAAASVRSGGFAKTIERCSAITALQAASLASCAAVSGRFGRNSLARLTRSSYSRCAAAPAAECPTPEERSASIMRAVFISGGGAANGPWPWA